MNPVYIGKRLIGKNQPCFLVAEIGINHNGDLELAKKTIDAAKDAGADAVKFQNYQTEDFVTDKSLTYRYFSKGKAIVESQYEIFKRCELTTNALRELKSYCDHTGISFHSTPTSQTGIQDLVKMGTLVLKNGSDYLTNLPLISSMGKTGLLTVISTGMSTLAEIDDAVRTFRETGNEQLILLHCTSSYPTPPEDVHLRKIPTLSAAFNCPVGFSDHTEGSSSAVGAIALGACWIEKHFTLDKELPGPDHCFSFNGAEFKILVDAVRVMERSLGNSFIGPSRSETLGRQDFRLSCVAARSLKANHCITEADIKFQRPGTGLPPKAINWLIGRRLACDVRIGHVLEQANFI